MKKLFVVPFLAVFFSCMAGDKQKTAQQQNDSLKIEEQKGMETATFAGGCFWCTEAVFLELDGVKSVVSGYIGGKTVNPTYKDVCSGDTGHAEAIQITFDPKKVTFGDLMEIFFATHDPTTLNRQGADVGTQYRSEIFYHNEDQRKLAEAYILELESENTYGFGKKVVTKVTKAPVFYPAEDYHQNYYAQNKQQPYCTFVITPKIEKVREKFKAQLKN
ncbi:MAG: peptide-methionine (S)-S-oxide reductase [Flavobacterium sp.]|uniref:peptide-methionine (S)-S-oxide reductase MsrA n=1 Tax=Flavobacterium sp. TaxID=239 RepID=UPI00120CC75C|nr:peptide-methionine (S)-S-oxide reductase MsrA [Flavobacterium sp.]RZJ67664.1 MAG: peptide-methionine (S)-S-oxide reductase [Flavobacterium sp.]